MKPGTLFTAIGFFSIVAIVCFSSKILWGAVLALGIAGGLLILAFFF